MDYELIYDFDFDGETTKGIKESFKTFENAYNRMADLKLDMNYSNFDIIYIGE